MDMIIAILVFAQGTWFWHVSKENIISYYRNF